jgi:hypothetical protein
MKFPKVLSEKSCIEYIEYFDKSYNYADGQVKGSNIIHNSPKAMELCFKFRPMLESKLSYKLQPYQGWIRKYVKGNVLHKHRDNRADVALSIMLGQSDNQENPLLIYYKDNPTEILLERGDGYFFEGSVIEHERPPIKSDYLYGLYLGYRKVEKETSLL